MLLSIIRSSVRNKFIVLLFTIFIIGYGIYSIFQIPVGAVPDVTNNQVQVLTTSRNLSTLDIEQFITYPIELEMANLPGIQEIRSVSKFGLSVVTLVFDDKMGTYLPRQLIAEKIKSATEKIPPEFGSPEMGPITTGLGEIYQYTLEVEDEFKDNYSLTDLRTIQDWIVKRQLAGIQGVVEVNTWGGYLKQYEVAIRTEDLNAAGVTISELFSALENNNGIAGGSYIQREGQAYFIRGEGLIGSMEDIRNTVVAVRNTTPILVKDIAEVRIGHAPRFGAVTGNGEGEKVLGQIMMLKGANSEKVISEVKNRVEKVQQSLPPGVYIHPFLDRSDLVEKTISTVIENLVIGFLIVAVIVILLIGNFRAGMIIASVIPICFLIALSLMHIFQIDVNLMSMGALDFGIIIDGAVIIVEFVALQLFRKSGEFKNLSVPELRSLRDSITIEGTTRMMKSAIFGQLIIIIVFIPILSLGGVEGKMFIPMALTFIFAIIAAILVCLTYVPVMASIFLSTKEQPRFAISRKIMDFLDKLYVPVLKTALNKKKTVLLVSLAVVVSGIFLFRQMGGEFIPQLDEGDFVIQPVMKTGKSLDDVIATTTKMEKILLDKFPEVKTVVTRIGAAEVPTDPMSMEETDVMVMLHPKSEWVTADTKDGLASAIEKELKKIPGVEIEFTQPIEMRFNELITGVRSDIAIKLFGNDLDVLQRKGQEIKSLIQHIEGAADIVVEKVTGLPQLSVRYNRESLAAHGLQIADINSLVALAFAGKNSGVIFEKEKRFDLVIRLSEDKRKGIEDLKNLLVDTPKGTKIPLRELADIQITEGPAKISRDETNRRIVVGVNVRNSDLQTVVDQIQKTLDEKLSIPPGYRITYGGQFENYQRATNRLLLAVPVSLILIFLMLYFAFKSVTEALLIYTAIPIAAMGGIFLLWARDMPFSISAGVGFIALFGVAVLNGIVLLEHYKTFDFSGGATSIKNLIIEGARDRLLPVMLTASTTALGFLPMAISTGAGAEVQRPVATVVIGGLITSTLLTLVVLPVFYSILKQRQITAKGTRMKTTLVLLLLFSPMTHAQSPEMDLDQLKQMALENNREIKSNQLNIEANRLLIRSAFTFSPTEIYQAFDQNDLALNGLPNYKFGLQQDFAFPTSYGSRKHLTESRYHLASQEYKFLTALIFQEITRKYYQVNYLHSKERILRELNTSYENFTQLARQRFEAGETNSLESSLATARHQKVQTELRSVSLELKAAYEELYSLTQSPSEFSIKETKYARFQTTENDTLTASGKDVVQLQKTVSVNEYKVQKQQFLPGISMEYFAGTNRGINQFLHGYQIGLKIPLLFGGDKAQVKAKELAVQMAELDYANYTYRLERYKNQLQQLLEAHALKVTYYESEGLDLAENILHTSSLSYELGEIDFFRYIQSLESAQMIQLEYLDALNSYNQTAITLSYLLL